MEQMTKMKLSEANPGDSVTDFFICSRKAVRTDRNGNRFLSLRLTDASGDIGAVMWDVSDAEIEAFAERDVVKVQGTFNRDNLGKPQVKLDKIRRATAEDNVAIERLQPVSPRDFGKMEEELGQAIDDIGNPHLAALLEAIFGDEQLYRDFITAPAAKGFHHNYIRGLLEHSLSVCRVAGAVAEQYPFVNRDLLLAGALLHDIGKTKEFDYATSTDYSDEGRLLGHIVLGEKIVADAIDRVEGFPPELKMQLLHLMLSHHGEYEYGSPRRPKTIEAFLLNQADDIDAKANVFMKLKNEAPGDWSEYNRVLERFLYLKKAEE